MATWYLQMSAVLGYPPAIIFGVPLHFWLRHATKTRLRFYLVSGALLGIAATALPFLARGIGGFPDLRGFIQGPTVQLLLLAVGFGMSSAALFWVIARPDRP
jgi:hypothetical protein